MQKMRTYRSHFRSNLVLNLFFCGFWLFIRALTFSLFQNQTFDLQLDFFSLVKRIEWFFVLRFARKKNRIGNKTQKICNRKRRVAKNRRPFRSMDGKQCGTGQWTFTLIRRSCRYGFDSSKQFQPNQTIAFSPVPKLFITVNQKQNGILQEQRIFAHNTHHLWKQLHVQSIFSLYLLISFGCRDGAHKICTH